VRTATNLLLDSLPEADRQAIDPHLKRVDVKEQQTLYDLHAIIKEIHFPIDAVISLVIPLSTGEIVETAMVGNDGVLGAAAALNGRASLNRAMVQIGGASLVCAVDPLRDILQTHHSIRSLLGAHEQALFAQAQQSAACNATHVIESRLCRWLLRAADLHGSDQLPLTQEYIAQMLGVRRTSVTVVVRTLQQAGLIRYRRGNINLIDIPALRETACECYETVKANYRELLQHLLMSCTDTGRDVREAGKIYQNKPQLSDDEPFRLALKDRVLATVLEGNLRPRAIL
jgi:CRP-like cAMP-binding protein